MGGKGGGAKVRLYYDITYGQNYKSCCGHSYSSGLDIRLY